MLLALAFSAGAFRLAAPGALGPTPLLVALAIVAYAALSRAALLSWFALRNAGAA